jgi:hypothetical protein
MRGKAIQQVQEWNKDVWTQLVKEEEGEEK